MTAARRSAMFNPKALRRFLSSFIISETGCWIWTKNIFPGPRSGYALFSVNGKPITGHRWSYLNFCGPLPAEMILHHKCSNRRCVNPQHLVLTTKKEHPDARYSLVRKRDHCVNGHKYTKDTLYLYTEKSTKRTIRLCRVCRRSALQQFRQRRENRCSASGR